MTSPTDTITLTDVQWAYVRTLLFDELRAGAEALADLATAAAEASTDEQQQHIAEVDTHSAYQRRVRVTAELLDAVGWSPPPCEASIFKHPRVAS
jgi:hypothetical protein